MLELHQQEEPVFIDYHTCTINGIMSDVQIEKTWGIDDGSHHIRRLLIGVFLRTNYNNHKGEKHEKKSAENIFLFHNLATRFTIKENGYKKILFQL